MLVLKWLWWMATLLQAVGLERITPKKIYLSAATTNKCNNERVFRTNDVRYSIPQCICHYHENSRLNETIKQDLLPN